MTTHIGTCKLCLLEGIELRNSHVIPKWAYKQVRGDSKDIVRLSNKVLRYSDQQLTEHLLCENCEQMIGLRENYVKSLSFDVEGRCQLVDLLNYTIGQSNNAYRHAFSDASLLNREYIAYFAASVVWRASILSKNRGLVSVGPYQEELRKYLNGNTILPKEANLLVYFHDPYRELNYHQLAAFPVTEKTGECHYHEFFCAGVLYRLFIGKTIPREVRILCLIHGDAPVVIWTSFHHDPAINRVKRTLDDAEIRGRLASKEST